MIPDRALADLILKELLRQDEESRPDTPGVWDYSDIRSVGVDGRVDFMRVAEAINTELRNRNTRTGQLSDLDRAWEKERQAWNEAIRAAENEALERAAKAIEAEHDFDQDDDGLTSTVEWCLRMIRALKHSEQTPTSS